ncbi:MULTISPECIES: cupin [unclassified Ornithinimicrobium]|uniref:cupin n=1 Tax=unclassified Ornithinimicrobium TaxID=2615080 RepID=UPI00385430A8
MTDEDHPILGSLTLTPVEADPERVVDLQVEGERLLARARERGTGRAVRAVVRQRGQHLILLALPAGGGLPDHDAPGPASLLCLSGEVLLSAGDAAWRLTPGTACAIPQARHEVHAAVDSVCVLVVSMR